MPKWKPIDTAEFCCLLVAWSVAVVTDFTNILGISAAWKLFLQMCGLACASFAISSVIVRFLVHLQNLAKERGQ